MTSWDWEPGNRVGVLKLLESRRLPPSSLAPPATPHLLFSITSVVPSNLIITSTH